MNVIVARTWYVLFDADIIIPVAFSTWMNRGVVAIIGVGSEVWCDAKRSKTMFMCTSGRGGGGAYSLVACLSH